jgi:hypothetical protein
MTIGETTGPLLTIRYTLSFQEAESGRRTAARAEMNAENSPIKYWLICLAACAILVFQVFNKVVREGGYVWLAIFVVSWVIVFTVLRRSSRVRNEMAVQTVTLGLHSDGLSFASERVEQFLRWTAFRRVTETNEFFLLQRRDAAAWVVIPKRAFADDRQTAWFGQLLREQASFAVEIELPPLPGDAALSGSTGVPAPGKCFTLRYTLSDCFRITVASWITRGLGLMMVGIYIAVFLGVMREERLPHQGGANIKGMALAAIFPVLFITFVACVFAIRLRIAVAKRSDVTAFLSEIGIAFQGRGSEEVLRWEAYDRFIEINGGFIVWKAFTRTYIFIPGRTLAAEADRVWMRSLLSQKLRRSIWFIGL